MTIDISSIGKKQDIKKIGHSEIDLFDINQLGDTLADITKGRMYQDDKLKVFDILQQLKKYTETISYEYIQYLLNTSKPYPNHRDTIPLVGSNYLKRATRTQMLKIKKLIREFNGNIKIDPKKVRFKEMQCNRGALQMGYRNNTFHFIDNL